MAVMAPFDSETAWQAVLGRDETTDGSFVYGVLTTGVYCRPACPSRRPRRENARFFETPAAAEAAGFRECRRCRPKSDAASKQLVDAARRRLEMDIEEAPGLDALANELGVSAGHLQRTFKRLTGVSPRQYAANLRAEAFKAHLRGGDDVTTATYAAGYGSISRVYDRASRPLAMTPGSYRRGGEGMLVAYTITQTPVGRVLLAATERGVCFIAIGDNDEEIEGALRREYPRAEVVRGDDAIRRYADALQDYVSSGLRDTSLPLDLKGSAFQLLVWRALQAIPSGETRTYREIAIAIGRPAAVRAVARACATNPLPLVVPCHRVVRGDGAIGGYRWGTSKKKALLEAESRT